MILIPIGIVWAGYTLFWFGWTTFQGEGVGFTDLILPGRIGQVDRILPTLKQPSGTVKVPPADASGTAPGVLPVIPAGPGKKNEA